jgi:DNA helicase-2/ATP-dependent DNA helicase PcrA
MSTPSHFLDSIPDELRAESPLRSQPVLATRRHMTPLGGGDAPELPDFQTGQRVFHNKFGDGVIISVTDKPSDKELVVEFVRHGQKRLLASFANLDVG